MMMTHTRVAKSKEKKNVDQITFECGIHIFFFHSRIQHQLMG